MSDELGQEAENLLKKTSILNHQYGIPKVEPNQTSANIKELENKYYTSYTSLNHKLNKLMYLNKIQEIETLSQEQINNQVEIIKHKIGISDSQELLDFLNLQNSEIKTNSLLNYLLLIKPILKSIHQSGLNTSEQNILSMLNELYDDENGLITNYKDEKFDKSTYDMITKVIKPLIEKSTKLNQTLKELNRKYVSDKEEQISNDSNINEGEKRREFYELVNKWEDLQNKCLEIPERIIDLPLNWYDNPELLSIMEQVDKIQIKLNKYLLIINKDTISMFSTIELLALEYPE